MKSENIEMTFENFFMTLETIYPRAAPPWPPEPDAEGRASFTVNVMCVFHQKQ
jgi:hypothetical protein